MDSKKVADKLDPVILALTQNRLDHISHQMGWVMVRTARSPIFSQAHDFPALLRGQPARLLAKRTASPYTPEAVVLACAQFCEILDQSWPKAMYIC